MTDTPGIAPQRFALCVDPGDYEVSLDRWKIYTVLQDPDAERHSQYRIVDESGEDYLYPQRYFRLIELPPAIVELYSAVKNSSTPPRLPSTPP